MPSNSYVSRLRRESARKIGSYRDMASASIMNGSSVVNIFGGTSAASGLESIVPLSEHAEQYRHLKGWTYVVISRIATRIAGQAVYVGQKKAAAKGRETTDARARLKLGQMVQPSWIKSIAPNGVKPVDNHPVISAIQNPNPWLVTWGLMWVTIASFEATGKSYWWMPFIDGELHIYPIPSHWVTPVHTKNRMFAEYKVQSQSRYSEEQTIPGEEMAYFPLPDPSDPVSTLSPLQAQAHAVATDEALQQAQFRSFKNGIFPGVLIKAGRLPGSLMPGQLADMPVLEPEQRRELIEACRAVYEGAVNYNEPLIIDGMIESVAPFTHSVQEMDFPKSGELVKSRIFQAFGVNPIIAGEVTGANRAQALAAEDNFNANVVNPTSDLISQVMTRWMSNRFDDKSLMLWIEPANKDDPDIALRKWSVAASKEWCSEDEYRLNVLGLPPRKGRRPKPPEDAKPPEDDD